jgi:hypothetical protein
MTKASRTSLRSVSQWNDPDRVALLLSLAKDGVTYKDIAVQLNTTYTCVKGKLEAMGVKKTKWFKPANLPAKAKTIPLATRHLLQVWETHNNKKPTIREFSWQKEETKV